MEKTSKNLDVILWTIFQYSNIIKICGFDLETGEFRISSAITSIVNEPTMNDLGGFEPKCTIYPVCEAKTPAFMPGMKRA